MLMGKVIEKVKALMEVISLSVYSFVFLSFIP
jgi:hypothetical protein